MNYHVGLLVAATAPTGLYELAVLTGDQTVMIYMMMMIGIILAIHESLEQIRTQGEAYTNDQSQ